MFLSICSPSVIFGTHCTPAGSGLHWPFLVQVMLMGCEGMSPSSHWKITIAFSVVDTSPSTLALEGIAGAPQSAVENSSQSCPAHTPSLTYALMLCWIRCPQAIAGTHCCHITLRLEPWITVIHNLSSSNSGGEGSDGAIHGRQGTGTASCREYILKSYNEGGGGGGVAHTYGIIFPV